MRRNTDRDRFVLRKRERQFREKKKHREKEDTENEERSFVALFTRSCVSSASVLTPSTTLSARPEELLQYLRERERERERRK
jgi:hypothetical protein